MDTNFSAGNSFCKAILCLLAYQEPKDFQDNGKVILDNSWLKVANSKNYHHFFPRAYLKNKTKFNRNSIVNITFVSDHLNKRKIGAKAPSVYISDFKDQNDDINEALNSHFIDLDGFGLENDDYEQFLRQRSKRIYNELNARISLTHKEPASEEIYELVHGGETEKVEFKSTLRWDIRQGCVNKKLEYVIAKTIAAFMNTEGGTLIMGVDDNQNALGLEKDYMTLKKQDLDGFELHLVEVFKKFIGVEYSSSIKIEFPEYDGKKICKVSISKSNTPIFTKFEGREDFFIRTGCSSQPLGREEQSKYEKEHWG